MLFGFFADPVTQMVSEVCGTLIALFFIYTMWKNEL